MENDKKERHQLSFFADNETFAKLNEVVENSTPKVSRGAFLLHAVKTFLGLNK